MLSITIIIIIATCVLSVSAFSQPKLMEDLIFYPPAIQRRQYYRFISHGFIHANYIHLAFNMLALYSFGVNLESVFNLDCIFYNRGRLFYLLLYFSALIVASLPDYFKYRDSYHFRSLGASGAISAVVFSRIIFFPSQTVGFFFIPMPGYVFAIAYLILSVYFDKRGGGNINHSAHFWGAAYGIVFTLVMCAFFADGFDVYENFLLQLKSASQKLVLICN